MSLIFMFSCAKCFGEKGVKQKDIVKTLIAALTCVLLALFQASFVFGAELSDMPVSEEAPAISMGMELKPPPDEALIVPELPAQPPAQLYYVPLLLIAIASVALLAFLCVKKVGVRRALPVATMIVAAATAPYLTGVVYAANDFGNPLNTSNIMLFAYYYDANGWVLANTVPAFENYTDHGNYYDGFVRVWMDQRADNNFLGSEFYVDVRVRVRADGWILAWLTTDQPYAYIVFWGHSVATNGPPVIGATVPSRAIQRVFYVSGKTFPGHTAINIYDFTHPTAKKLLVFGKTAEYFAHDLTASVAFYYTIPSYVQVTDAATSISFWEKHSYNWGKIYFDGTLIDDMPSTKYWHSASLPSSALAKETKHTVQITLYCYNSQYSRANFAIILWLQ